MKDTECLKKQFECFCYPGKLQSQLIGRFKQRNEKHLLQSQRHCPSTASYKLVETTPTTFVYGWPGHIKQSFIWCVKLPTGFVIIIYMLFFCFCFLLLINICQCMDDTRWWAGWNCGSCWLTSFLLVSHRTFSFIFFFFVFLLFALQMVSIYMSISDIRLNFPAC